jgi:hypothetical protein
LNEKAGVKPAFSFSLDVAPGQNVAAGKRIHQRHACEWIPLLRYVRRRCVALYGSGITGTRPVMT